MDSTGYYSDPHGSSTTNTFSLLQTWDPTAASTSPIAGDFSGAISNKRGRAITGKCSHIGRSPTYFYGKTVPSNRRILGCGSTSRRRETYSQFDE